MKESYQPPCTITPEILSLVADIAENIGRLSESHVADSNLRLRRANRIKTVHGSCAIEGNTLSEEQITAILEGKRVLASPKEIQEVENALVVYDKLATWNPTSLKQLLTAHKMLMGKLEKEAGQFRSGSEGVMKGRDVVHVAPPASMVPTLVNQLLLWLKKSKTHPLIASSVFHYEFEYIHPFADGNGRMGRLWQTLILTAWNPLFAWLPVENIILQHQKRYYASIEEATRQADISPFVNFMLEVILKTVREIMNITPEVTPEVGKLLKVLKGAMSRSELMKRMRLTDEKNFRIKYIQCALEAGLIERTIPDKPKSRSQKYRLTREGENVVRTTFQGFH